MALEETSNFSRLPPLPLMKRGIFMSKADQRSWNMFQVLIYQTGSQLVTQKVLKVQMPIGNAWQGHFEFRKQGRKETKNNTHIRRHYKEQLGEPLVVRTTNFNERLIGTMTDALNAPGSIREKRSRSMFSSPNENRRTGKERSRKSNGTGNGEQVKSQSNGKHFNGSQRLFPTYSCIFTTNMHPGPLDPLLSDNAQAYRVCNSYRWIRCSFYDFSERGLATYTSYPWPLPECPQLDLAANFSAQYWILREQHTSVLDFPGVGNYSIFALSRRMLSIYLSATLAHKIERVVVYVHFDPATLRKAIGKRFSTFSYGKSPLGILHVVRLHSKTPFLLPTSYIFAVRETTSGKRQGHLWRLCTGTPSPIQKFNVLPFAMSALRNVEYPWP